MTWEELICAGVIIGQAVGLWYFFALKPILRWAGRWVRE